MLYLGAVQPIALYVSLPKAGSYSQSAADFQSGVILPIQAGDTYYNGGQYGDAITAYKAAGQTGATTVGPEIDLGGPRAVTQKITQNAWKFNGKLKKMAGDYPTSHGKKTARRQHWDALM